MASILLAEDDESMRRFLAQALERAGHDVTACGDGAQAYECLRGIRFDLLLSDIVMPGGISGIELARKVRDRFPELPILLTTGYSEQVAGTHGFPVLHKPYEMDSLAGAVRKILKDNVTAR